MDNKTIQSGAVAARKAAEKKKAASMAIRKRDITIRSEFNRTKDFSWTDAEKLTPARLAQEYDLPIETINQILRN